MSRDDFIKMEGIVTDVLPAKQYAVRLEGGAVIRARISGKIRMNKISILPGDRVTVEISPYDVTNGCIVYRTKNTPHTGNPLNSGSGTNNEEK